MAKFARKLVIFLIVGVILLMFATGRLSWQDLKYQTQRIMHRGRSAAGEMTTTVLHKASHDEAALCRANLELLERGKRKVADEERMVTGEVTVQQVQSALGGSLPVCPSGGTYTLNPLVRLPTCSIGAGSDALSKADDHLITAY